MIVEIHSFRAGKTTGRNANPRTYPLVTVITRDAVDRVLGTTPKTRTARLRELRDQGRLVCGNRGRLTQVVKDELGRRFRAYVFAGGRDSLPVAERRRRQRREGRGRVRVITG